MALCWCALVITFAVFLPFLTAAGFIDTPGNVTVHVGETAILQCSVDPNNFQKVMIMYWYKSTIHIGLYVTIGESVREEGIDAERYSLDTSNVGGVFTYNLRITNAEVADSGQYQCRATDPDGTRRTEPGILTVVQETNNETMSCSIYPEAPTLGQTVTFSCIAPRGISPDMLTWWMDGTVQIQPEANLTNGHGISFVKTLTEADNFAEFTCLVGSSFSTTRNGMNCSVTPLAVPIRAEVTPSVLNAVIDGNATFRCRGTAIPSVQRYRWLYGLGDSTIKISESNGRFSVVNNEDSSTFTITRLTAEDNRMMVRCVVQNAITTTFDLAELHVSTTRMEFTSQQKTSPVAQTLEVSSLSTTIATETKTEHTSGTFISAELHLSTTQIPTQQPTTPAAKTDGVSLLSTTIARNQERTSGTSGTFRSAQLHVSTTQIPTQQPTTPAAKTDEVSSLSTTIARNQDRTSGTSGTFRSAELHLSTTILSTTQIPTQQPTTLAAKTDEVSSLSTTIARNQDSTSVTSGTFSSAELHLSTTQIPTQQPTTPAAKTDEVSSLNTTIARNQDRTSGTTGTGFIDTPGNVTVHVGETAILQCSVDTNNFQKFMIMFWYKSTIHDGFYVAIGESVRAKGIGAEKYSLDTSNVGGVFTYNLRITNAEVADSGQYQCRATERDGTRRTEPGSLTVVQETNNETMSCSIYPETPTLGQTITFSCIAPRDISPDMLTWTDGTFQIIQPEANLTNEHGISFVKTLAEADNFAEFTCLVGSSFSTTRNGMNCSVTPLAVPIRAVVTPSVLNAVIAGNATFRCRGTAIPSVQRYRWLYGSGDSTIKISKSKGRFSVVNNGDSSTFTITRLTAEDNNMMVRCVVQNAITKTFDLAELRINYSSGS
ncbi:uncharacterized protein [Asterias amurensis]|uniref:uncharacterized protein n=1 Tax=Asterias amurensis TaxID=7602 RepID=UPI003AB4B3A2